MDYYPVATGKIGRVNYPPARVNLGSAAVKITSFFPTGSQFSPGVETMEIFLPSLEIVAKEKPRGSLGERLVKIIGEEGKERLGVVTGVEGKDGPRQGNALEKIGQVKVVKMNDGLKIIPVGLGVEILPERRNRPHLADGGFAEREIGVAYSPGVC